MILGYSRPWLAVKRAFKIVSKNIKQIRSDSHLILGRRPSRPVTAKENWKNAPSELAVQGWIEMPLSLKIACLEREIPTLERGSPKRRELERLLKSRIAERLAAERELVREK